MNTICFALGLICGLGICALYHAFRAPKPDKNTNAEWMEDDA